MAHKYKTILVAVDGSDASEKAFKRAVDIAKDYDAKLVITHVIDTSLYSATVMVNVPYTEQLETFAKNLLNEYKEKALESSVEEVLTYLDYGSPKVKISKQIADKFDADLIVCGARGHNAMERFLIGSVSEHIIRYAKIDVLVVRD
jgi:nucleotide-binding universal stress UspA family protein